MTALAGLALGIVIGFLLGGTGPRRELAAAQAEIRELESALDEAGPRRGLRSPVPGLDRILSQGTEHPSAAVAPSPEREARDAGVSDGAPVADEGWRDDPYLAFERAASVQRVRSVQSRAALGEQAELSESELAEVDDAIAEMNEQLVGYGEELMFLALDGREPPPGDLLGITHDVTGILHRAQQRLETVLGERATQIDAEARRIWNYVDLDRLEPAARAAMERGR